MMQYEILFVYLELVEARLKLRSKMHGFGAQADEFNKFMAGIEGDISTRNYGADLEECELLLAKFTEQLEVG